MPIVYGFPGDQTVEHADRGEIQLGGCCVSDNDLELLCRGPVPHYWRRGEHGQLVLP